MRHLRWVWWSCLLGFALGGFFDGVLLHQILQWHHLLSLVPGVGDLRSQVLWDGYFHALMYVLAVLGLWGLWRTRRSMQGLWGRQLIASAAIGFGAWHIVDGVLSHWILGIHRIKLDSATPLVWDVIWLAAFGALPAILGWLWLRAPGDNAPGGKSPAAAIVLLGLFTGAAGFWAMQPATDQPFTTIVFRSGVAPASVLGALAEAEAELVWASPTLSVAVVNVEARRKWSFYRHGALLVSGAGLPAGCLGWSKV